ncbi:dephospho-CoA kinase [Desulfovulcanus sp.]
MDSVKSRESGIKGQESETTRDSQALDSKDSNIHKQLDLIVPDNAHAQRLDVFLFSLGLEEGVTRAKVQKWIKQGLVTIHGRRITKPSFKISSGQKVKVLLPLSGGENKTRAISGQLDVIYEDKHILVVNKPAGLTVHPAPGEEGPTLVNFLVYNYPQLAQKDSDRPGIVHRLDKDTSGLMLIALTDQARLDLIRDFSARQVDKEYLALVFGVPENEQGEINLPIGRDPKAKTRMAVVKKGGRRAISRYAVVLKDKQSKWSLLRVKIFTGRTHQIRVHLSHLGHSIIGDNVYGGTNFRVLGESGKGIAKLVKRQLLHAWCLGFSHPKSGEEMEFTCLPPKDFWRTPLILMRETQRIVLTGNPGSGKSEVLKCFKKFGVPVFSADEEVASLYQPGGDGWFILRQRFGEKFIAPETGEVDKKKLFAEMVASETFRREVNALIHPLVEFRLHKFWERHKRQRVCVAEIPLILEAGWKTEYLVLVGVFCRDEQRKKRLMMRGWTEQQMAQIEAWHWPQADKLRKCHLIIDNSNDLWALEQKVLAVGNILKTLRQKKVRQLKKRLDIFYQTARLLEN